MVTLIKGNVVVVDTGLSVVVVVLVWVLVIIVVVVFSITDDVISIESLSALYQSVDFSSKDFNNPEQTINSLNVFLDKF